jgi:hypothetical protein
MSKELVGNCVICKKECYRGDYIDFTTGEAENWSSVWYYYEPIGFVCRHHHGVEEWYKGVLEEMNKKLEALQALDEALPKDRVDSDSI